MKMMNIRECRLSCFCRVFMLQLLLLTAGIAGAADAPSKQPAAAPAMQGHPPLGGNHPPVVAPVREGNVAVDPKAKFVHFRVGNKNVKSLYADRGVIWVGTSGGLVRYDTKDDSFKLFDTKNGLLSNGMFFVGKVKDRIAVGTYGGGMSLLDEKTGKWQTYNIPEGLGDAFIYDVITAKNGDIWIATWSGVNRVRGGDLDNRSKWELHTVDSTKGGLPKAGTAISGWRPKAAWRVLPRVAGKTGIMPEAWERLMIGSRRTSPSRAIPASSRCITPSRRRKWACRMSMSPTTRTI